MFITAVFILMVNAEVLGIKCYQCNSVESPELCGYIGRLTEQSKNQTVECNGRCSVSSIHDKSDEAHLRICRPNVKVIGCDSKTDGFLCQCSTDFCNKDIPTCHKLSKCDDELKPRYMTQSSNGQENFAQGTYFSNLILTLCNCIFVCVFMYLFSIDV